MAERVGWPAWRYGPNGEAHIFTCAADVPEGWSKQPQPVPEKRDDDIPGLEELRAENEQLRTSFDDMVSAYESRIRELEQQSMDLRRKNERLEEKAATGTPLPRHEQSEAPQSVRRPRKLSTKEPELPGTPFTPQDETITVDEGRAERLAVLHAAGVEIADDATDGEIEAALNWLEKQTEKS